MTRRRDRGDAYGFIVGCPRSGTTLLQAFLDGHSGILTVGETHFFQGLTTPLLGSVGLVARKRARFNWSGLAEDGGRPLPLLRSYGRGFRRAMDRRSEAAGASIWLEKTPGHIYAIDTIERCLPAARFIHLLRNGPDVIASLYEVSRRAPKLWGGPYEIDDCIDRWLDAVGRSERVSDDPRHLVVRYSDLVCSPEETLGSVTDFLGVPYSQHMISHRDGFADSLNLPWHSRVGEPLELRPLQKFRSVLESDEQAHVLQRLDEEAPEFALELHAGWR